MNYDNELQYNDDMNFEDMDDLALPDHIEWNNKKNESFSLEALDIIDM
jgi:hypothetical protein